MERSSGRALARVLIWKGVWYLRGAHCELCNTREMFNHTNASFIAYDINVAESPIQLSPDERCDQCNAYNKR